MGQWRSQPVCTTPACIHAASYILQNLAPNWAEMDPCAEFDKMVCYGFSEHHGDDLNYLNAVNARNQNILKKILESTTEAQAAGVRSTFLTSRSSNSEEHNFDLLRTGWSACMDAEARAKAGIKPLSDFVATINQTWPVSPEDLHTTVSVSDYDGLQKADQLLESVNIRALHKRCSTMTPDAVNPDPSNSKVNRVCINPPKPLEKGVNASMYDDPETRKFYTGRVARAFRLTYTNLDEAAAEALAGAVVQFEADIVKTVRPFEGKGDGSDIDSSPVVSLAEVGAAAPVLGLDKLAAAMTPPGKTPTEIMLVYPKFWPEFAAVISNHSRAAVQGYMAWKSITSLVEYINDPELWTVIGVQTNLLPWQLCVNQVDTQLRHVLDYYFVSAAYSNQTLQAADKLTTNIRNQFKKRLGELDWMSAESKRRAIQKAENMLQTIGYPTVNPDLRSPDSIASFYAGLNLTSASHFTNMLSVRRYTTLQSYATVLTPPNRNYYFQSISHANAAYDFTVNSMSVPAGISQLPLFHPDLPDYMLYGGLGATIGHEITHGFDDTGRRFDENAEYRAWWDNGTISSFQRRADCFVKQYGQYEVDVPGPGGKKARVDGNLTLGENIADAGGLHTAYDAWVAERKAMPAAWDQNLPGLGGFTHEQLFYLAWGNSWCSSLTPATVASQLTDVHAPDRVRLLAGAMNSRGFLEAWKCKTKEPVCELW